MCQYLARPDSRPNNIWIKVPINFTRLNKMEVNQYQNCVLSLSLQHRKIVPQGDRTSHSILCTFSLSFGCFFCASVSIAHFFYNSIEIFIWGNKAFNLVRHCRQFLRALVSSCPTGAHADAVCEHRIYDYIFYLLRVCSLLRLSIFPFRKKEIFTS